MPYKIERGLLIDKPLLHPNPWNPNMMGDRVQDAIKESINEYGQVLELLVRPHPEIDGEYQILDGEHRFNVLPAQVYCNVIYGVPDAHAKKLTIVMNETRGSAGKVELSQLLSEIGQDLTMDDLIKGLPYDRNELEELVKLSEINWDNFQEDGSQFDNDSHPVHDSDSDLKMFSALITNETLDLLEQSKMLSDDLPSDPRIAWGVVLGNIASDFLARMG